jgi:Flp pilus assembly protein TadD
MRFLTAAIALMVLCGSALAQDQSDEYARHPERPVINPPGRDEAPAPALDPSVLDRVGRAVVLIERVDKSGRQLGPACAFVDSRGYVVTNRHCIEGAAGIKLNLGAEGLFDLPTIVAVSEDLDVAMLTGEFPRDAVGRLEWADREPRKHSGVCIVVRDQDGRVNSSAGWSGDVDFDSYGTLTLSTSASAWLGCSGSPLVDAKGRAVGVVNRLGRPVTGQSRSTGDAALCTDVLSLAIDKPQRVSDWKGGGGDVDWKRFDGYRHAAEDMLSYDPARAIEYARYALQFRPHDLRSAYTLAYALDLQHKGDEATSFMTKMIEATPDDPAPNLALGHRYYTARKYSEAVLAYKESIRIRPLAVSWFWLGMAQWWQQDLAAAAASYEESVKLEPRGSRAWEQLSRLYSILNKPEEMVRIAKRRLSGDPDDPELLATLAAAQLRAEHTDDYEKTMSYLRDFNPYLANRAEIPSADYSEWGRSEK